MSASVKLSLRAAQLLLELVDGGAGIYGVPHEDAEKSLREAIARATRASATRKRLGAPKRAKKATKRVRTAAVRAAVMARANGFCECGCYGPLSGFSGEFRATATLDHFEGRARSESLETCWALRAGCHESKTRNHPSRAAWLHRFILHCEKHGYAAQAEKARVELQVEALLVEARGAR